MPLMFLFIFFTYKCFVTSKSPAILGINSHSSRNSFTPSLLVGAHLKRRSEQKRGRDRNREWWRTGEGREREREREWWRDLAGFRHSIRSRASGNCLVCSGHYRSSHISPPLPGLTAHLGEFKFKLNVLLVSVCGWRCERVRACVCVYLFHLPWREANPAGQAVLTLSICVAGKTWGSRTLSLVTPQSPLVLHDCCIPGS